MKNKKTLLIAGCLALLCCGVWTRTTLITKTKAKAANRVRIQVTPDLPGAVGAKLTTVEVLSMLPETLKAKALAQFAEQGWTDTTKVNVVVERKGLDGIWRQIGLEMVDKNDVIPCFCCKGGDPASGCPCCDCQDGSQC